MRIRNTVLAALLVLTLASPAAAQAKSLSLSGPLPAGFLVSSLQGTETLSQPYEFEIELTAESASAQVSFDSMLGQHFTVTSTQPDGTTRHFSGICNRVSQGTRDKLVFVRLELVPKFWLLTRTARSRMFHDLSVPQIVSSILGEHGVAHELSLQATYPSRSCAVQYNETDFEFLHRLIEEEGIFYFFRHQPGVHTMVLGDSPQSHPTIPGTSNVAFSTSTDKPGVILSWEKSQELRSARYTLRDHSFALPGDALEVQSAAQEAVTVGPVTHALVTPVNAKLEMYDYPGDYAGRFDGVDTDRREVLEEGQRTVEIRMQQEASESISIVGTSSRPQLTAGHKFTLAAHSFGNGPYVLTRVSHSATAAGVYSNSFTCIPAGLPFRPKRVTPRPSIPGPQPALVAGPAPGTVHTDGNYRVKVKFPWVRDDTASCWMPVTQLATGGSMVLPEVGDEVLVAFLQGDPDRPIVLGRTLNPN